MELEQIKELAQFISVVLSIAIYATGWGITLTIIKDGKNCHSITGYCISIVWLSFHVIGAIAGLLCFCVWGWM